jgi:hypothetical protein
VTEPAKAQNDVLLDSSIPGASLESILCTQELRNRPSRSPDYEKENRALVALANALADSPGTILQTLTDKVFDLLHSDSAGLSLLTKDENRFSALGGPTSAKLCHAISARAATCSTTIFRCYSPIGNGVIRISSGRCP